MSKILRLSGLSVVLILILSFSAALPAAANSFTWTDTIGDAPGMGEYVWYDDDFGWTHTGFDSTGKLITSATLEIMAYDVDYDDYEPESDIIYIDGNEIGNLDYTAEDGWGATTFDIDTSLAAEIFADGEAYVFVDIDALHDEEWWGATIGSSTFTVTWEEDFYASFTASPAMGDAPLTVQFKSQSSGDIEDYYWSFGDGGHSSSKHPSHTYQNEGSYTVTLRVSGNGITDSFTLYNAIIVEAQTVAPNLIVRDLNVSSTYVAPGQAVGVTARVYNDGGSWGSDTMNLLVNGATENSAGVGVAPGTAQTVSFTLYRTTPGEYQVTFGDATATFFVMEQAQQATPASGLLAGGELDTGGIIAIICIAVIIVAGVVIAFLFARRT